MNNVKTDILSTRIIGIDRTVTRESDFFASRDGLASMKKLQDSKHLAGIYERIEFAWFPDLFEAKDFLIKRETVFDPRSIRKPVCCEPFVSWYLIAGTDPECCDFAWKWQQWVEKVHISAITHIFSHCPGAEPLIKNAGWNAQKQANAWIQVANFSLLPAAVSRLIHKLRHNGLTAVQLKALPVRIALNMRATWIAPAVRPILVVPSNLVPVEMAS